MTATVLRDEIVRNLGEHLKNRGRLDDLDRVLRQSKTVGDRTVNRWHWEHARLAERTRTGSRFLDDVNLIRHAAEQNDHVSGTEIRYALITAHVIGLAGNVPPELIAELVRRDVWTMPQALDHLKRLSSDDDVATTLTALAEQVPASSSRDVFDAAQRVGNAGARIRILFRLLEQGSSFPELRTAIFHDLNSVTTQDDRDIVEAFQFGAVRFGEPDLVDLLHWTDRVTPLERRARFLAVLAQVAEPAAVLRLVPRARELAAAPTEASRASVATLLGELSVRVAAVIGLPEGVDLAMMIPEGEDGIRLTALANLLAAPSPAGDHEASTLHNQLCDLIMARLGDLPESSAAAIAARLVRPRDVQRALGILDKPRPRGELAHAIARLGRQREAIALATAVTEPERRCRLLLSLCALVRRRARRALLAHAAEAAWMSGSKAAELLVLVARMTSSPGLWGAALQEAERGLAAGELETEAYGKLLPHVEDAGIRDQMTARCLKRAMAGEPGYRRRQIIATIAPYMSKDMLLEALDDIGAGDTASAEAQLLSQIARVAPTTLASRLALDGLRHVITKITEVDKVVDAFDGLAHHLDVTARREAADLARAVSARFTLGRESAAKCAAGSLLRLAITEPEAMRRDELLAESLAALVMIGEAIGIANGPGWSASVPDFVPYLQKRHLLALLVRADSIWVGRYRGPSFMEPVLEDVVDACEWLDEQDIIALTDAMAYARRRHNRTLRGRLQWRSGNARIRTGTTIGRDLLVRMARWTGDSFRNELYLAVMLKMETKLRPILRRQADFYAEEFRARVYNAILPRLCELGEQRAALRYAIALSTDSAEGVRQRLQIIAKIAPMLPPELERQLDYADLIRQGINTMMAVEDEWTAEQARASLVKGGRLEVWSGFRSALEAEAEAIADEEERLEDLAILGAGHGGENGKIWRLLTALPSEQLRNVCATILRHATSNEAIAKVESIIGANPDICCAYASLGLLAEVVRTMHTLPEEEQASVLAVATAKLAAPVSDNVLAVAVDVISTATLDRATCAAIATLARQGAHVPAGELTRRFREQLRATVASGPAELMSFLATSDYLAALGPGEAMLAESFAALQDVRRWWGGVRGNKTVHEPSGKISNVLSIVELTRLDNLLDGIRIFRSAARQAGGNPRDALLFDLTD